MSQTPEARPGFRRIYIVGSVESFKTALARKLSHKYGLPLYSLDNVVWQRRPQGDVKRSDEQRDKIFQNIIISEKWIIEDVMRPCFFRGLKKADVIILIDPPKRRGRFSAILRRLRQAFRFERSQKRPVVSILKSRHFWLGNSEMNRRDFMKKLEPYRSKVIELHTPQDIDNFF